MISGWMGRGILMTDGDRGAGEHREMLVWGV
jgi:hypothetical protein